MKAIQAHNVDVQDVDSIMNIAAVESMWEMAHCLVTF